MERTGECELCICFVLLWASASTSVFGQWKQKVLLKSLETVPPAESLEREWPTNELWRALLTHHPMGTEMLDIV